MPRTMMTIFRTVFVTIVICLIHVSCAKITVLHQDYSHQRISVIIDGKTKTMAYGDELTERVSKGQHRIEAIPEGKKQCPWTEDGKGWTLWVDRKAVLTLLPPPPTPSSIKSASNERREADAAPR